MVNDDILVVLWGAASRIYSKQPTVYLFSCYLVFSSGISLESKRCKSDSFFRGATPLCWEYSNIVSPVDRAHPMTSLLLCMSTLINKHSSKTYVGYTRTFFLTLTSKIIMRFIHFLLALRVFGLLSASL